MSRKKLLQLRHCKECGKAYNSKLDSVNCPHLPVDFMGITDELPTNPTAIRKWQESIMDHPLFKREMKLDVDTHKESG